MECRLALGVVPGSGPFLGHLVSREHFSPDEEGPQGLGESCGGRQPRVGTGCASVREDQVSCGVCPRPPWGAFWAGTARRGASAFSWPSGHVGAHLASAAVAHPPVWPGRAGLGWGFSGPVALGASWGKWKRFQSNEGLPAALASGALPVHTPKLECVVCGDQRSQGSCHKETWWGRGRAWPRGLGWAGHARVTWQALHSLGLSSFLCDP